jgi:predicted phage gp36 major capsid-like protein
LVVKAENEHGRRLRIDKQQLRDWREHFAELMREQGIAANATPRAIRGENKRTRGEKVFRAQRYGKSRSRVTRDRVMDIAKELSRTGTLEEPAQARLRETRKGLVSAWMRAADVLGAQGAASLARDVRYFAGYLPPVLTDRQRLAAQFIRFSNEQRRIEREGPADGYAISPERTP